MSRARIGILGLALVLTSGLDAAADQRGRGRGNEGNGRGAAAEARPRDDDSYFHRRGHTRLNIPKGHYPPPGKCRIWFPDRPPGHQPPPVACEGARVPLGAWLIRHPHDTPDHVHVVVYDDHRPGTVLAIGEFNIGTGVFVRVVWNR